MEKASKTYYAPGKLLITGEYLILYGTAALAVPVRFGQHLKVKPTNTNTLKWTSYNHQGNEWFFAEYSLADWSVISCTDTEKASYLLSLLINANATNKLTSGAEVTTHLDFPNEWGLGSSSTLTALVAEWLNTNALELHFTTSNGSGYDVAVAKEKSALFYRLNNQTPSVKRTQWNPPFAKQIYFVHLNRKQISQSSVNEFKHTFNPANNEALLQRISAITEEIHQCTNIETFNNLLNEHEAVMSKVLSIPPIGQTHFSDYSLGSIKSLGAWGGDFILVSGNEKTPDYFKNKGFSTVLSWAEMVIHA
jgi:mevalonate kinase